MSFLLFLDIYSLQSIKPSFIQMLKFLFCVVLFSYSLKILLVPSYHSTDFDVHRNWLSITHNLPINRWYYENTSEWTLDYPPYFAWFEYILSKVAFYFDSNMLKISVEGYYSYETLIFQRISVMVSDLLLLFGAYLFCKVSIKNMTKCQDIVIIGLIICNPSLLMIDHIHFQYNGFLLGILLISISFIINGNDLLASIFFCVLLCFKHIYSYIIPIYVVYLLRNYCGFGKINIIQSLIKVITLGMICISIALSCFLPFLYQNPIENLKQIISRLFPFKRGLQHTYWASNFWSLYIIADKIIYFIIKKLFVLIMKEKWEETVDTTGDLTNGILGNTHFHILPTIPPFITMILTVIAMIPCLLKIYKYPKKELFIYGLIYCQLCSYYFGWHVHEKAILTCLIPMTLLCCDSSFDSSLYILLNTVSAVTISPLLFPLQEKITVFFLLLNSIPLMYYILNCYMKYKQKEKNYSQIGIYYDKKIILAYLGEFCVFIYYLISDYILFMNKRFPFLPLLLISVYNSLLLLFSFKYIWKCMNRKIISLEEETPSPR